MKLNNKNLYTRASLILLVVHFLSFAVLYFSEFVFSDSRFMTYLWYFIQKATFLLLPFISALLILIADAYMGIKAALLRLIPLAMAKTIYSLPYYYLYFVYDPFYDSGDAILFSLIQSLLESIVLYVFTLIIFFIMKSTVKALCKNEFSVSELLSKRTVLNFSDPISLTFMLCSALCFVYFLIEEIINTVSVISRYSGRLMGGEIAYMVFSYVVDIILPALYYFALSYIKNSIIENRLTVDGE